MNSAISSLLFGLVLVVLTVESRETNIYYKDCAHHEIKSFVLSGCEQEAHSCVIHKNRNYTVEIKFLANENTGNFINTRVLAKIEDIELEWPGISGVNACKEILPCPLVEGQTYLYKLNFRLSSIIPNVKTLAMFILEDEHKKSLACAKTHIIIKP